MKNSFISVLEKYRKISFSERDKGDRFERLMKAYLLTDPKYAFKFQNVWLWEEFVGKNDLGGKDTGIDLVALTNEGDYWAIQCKCYQETSIIDKPSVDSFLSTSSRTFKDADLKTQSFSHRLWISTTNKWGGNAEEAIKNQNPPVSRINLFDLIDAPLDWEKLDKGITGEVARTDKKTLRPHQTEALKNTEERFLTEDRGKLIMACGTGKTFTSLRIAENQTEGEGLILFLVPSIALLGQTLNEWYADAFEPIDAICICSDPKITKKRKQLDEIDTASVLDLALPASTDVKDIIKQFQSFEKSKNKGLKVVFSTYQSIDVIIKTQRELEKINSKYAQFDLIICDEAHRTTGISLANEDESAFTKVHNNELINSKKRLYMTATPRLYDDTSKSKAAQAEAILCSMDDEKIYGNEIYRIGFGQAVEKGLLADYKVLILTLSEDNVPPAVQKMIADRESEINTDDASKLIGCINALSKQLLGDEGILKKTDPDPMRRAVAFCQNIKVSKTVTSNFNTASETYVSELPQKQQDITQLVASKHIDGSMNATERNDLLAWLKDEPSEKECRVLTNVRCLSEGVDVPSLDAVLFLSARNSQVDVVQSVGRVMRKSPNKKYGYIIIPVVVPSNLEASQALDDNKNYQVVWTVLNALRAHDDRFDAIVNKIELNKNRPDQILVGRPEISFDSEGNPVYGNEGDGSSERDKATQLNIHFENLQKIVFARMVDKVGDRRYWEQWAKEVAQIAQRQQERITKLIKDNPKHNEAFGKFLEGLHQNINPSIVEIEAIEMLSQHIITKPVFDALFEGYSFVENNPISKSMQKMLDVLEGEALEKDVEKLEKFYDSVKLRASGIDNAEGKQRIIIELYDKFFKTAFPKLVEKLGIVYSPVEVVDFIIHSVDAILKKEFDRNISDENIHILDPFTGTGTFITRLLQSNLIKKEDLLRKYTKEIHCNEIVLLAYYIAAVNIENAFHDLQKKQNEEENTENEYQTFEGICLTDTFQLGETQNSEQLFSDIFPQNSKRVKDQQKAPLRIIMGNPPYSVGQKSANDNAQNQDYPKLDSRIANTYVNLSSASSNKSLYDSYIKAFRWSSDRLDKTGGIISFVSNGSWLDGNSTDGFRNSIVNEFTSIYVFNLRGNQRTSGELSRKEGGKIFGSGSRTPVSITLLVKNPAIQTEKATIYYHDIGDYLSQDEKLGIIKKFKSFGNKEMKFKIIKPNEYGDWINQRNEAFDNFIPLAPKKKYNIKAQSFFLTVSLGTTSKRDAWVYNFSNNSLKSNVKITIEHFNEQLELINSNTKKTPAFNSKKANWSGDWMKKLKRNKKIVEEENEYRLALYRPFLKTNTYFGNDLNASRYQLTNLFPNKDSRNIIICVSASANDGLALLISNHIVDIHFNGDTQCFPLYYYEENQYIQKGMFDDDSNKYIRRDGVSNFIFERAKKQYGKNVTKEDIFYYVYGFLHSPSYREMFANDLKKMLPRLPLVEDVRDFWKFSKAGRELAELHLNYEDYKVGNSGAFVLVNRIPIEDVLTNTEDGKLKEVNYKVKKMRFLKKDRKDTIIYNSQITIENIPLEAYDYVVNGKSAIEWIMERYQVKTHKDSGIVNNPNDWSAETGNEKYILELLLSIINVSLQTVAIVKELPKVDFE